MYYSKLVPLNNVLTYQTRRTLQDIQSKKQDAVPNRTIVSMLDNTKLQSS